MCTPLGPSHPIRVALFIRSCSARSVHPSRTRAKCPSASNQSPHAMITSWRWMKMETCGNGAGGHHLGASVYTKGTLRGASIRCIALCTTLDKGQSQSSLCPSIPGCSHQGSKSNKGTMMVRGSAGSQGDDRWTGHCPLVRSTLNGMVQRRGLYRWSAGREHGVILTQKGSIYTTALTDLANRYGQLGIGPTLETITRKKAAGDTDSNELVKQADQAWLGTGTPKQKQLSEPELVGRPVTRMSLNRITNSPWKHAASQPTDITCGAYHTLLRCADGTVYGWGSNKSLQLCIGPYDPQQEVIAVPFNCPSRIAAKLHPPRRRVSLSVRRRGRRRCLLRVTASTAPWGRANLPIALGHPPRCASSPVPTTLMSPQSRSSRAGSSTSLGGIITLPPSSRPAQRQMGERDTGMTCMFGVQIVHTNLAPGSMQIVQSPFLRVRPCC